jgi:hypothetical protein
MRALLPKLKFDKGAFSAKLGSFYHWLKSCVGDVGYTAM